MSMSLLEKAGLSHRGDSDKSGFSRTQIEPRRAPSAPSQRHDINVGNPRRLTNDDDDDDLDDDKLIWLDK